MWGKIEERLINEHKSDELHFPFPRGVLCPIEDSSLFYYHHRKPIPLPSSITSNFLSSWCDFIPGEGTIAEQKGIMGHYSKLGVDLRE